MSIVKTYEKRGFISDLPFQRLLKVLVSPKRDNELQNMSVGMTIISPGNKTKYAAHETSEEIMYVISGRGEALIDGVKSKICPDMLINVPIASMHQLINTSDESLKMLWVFSPPGPEEEYIDILKK